MHDYGLQKEARGYSVWTLAPYTGDRRGHIRDFETKRQALNAIDGLRRNAAGRAALTRAVNRALANGAPIYAERRS